MGIARKREKKNEVIYISSSLEKKQQHFSINAVHNQNVRFNKYFWDIYTHALIHTHTVACFLHHLNDAMENDTGCINFQDITFTEH